MGQDSWSSGRGGVFHDHDRAYTTAHREVTLNSQPPRGDRRVEEFDGRDVLLDMAELEAVPVERDLVDRPVAGFHRRAVGREPGVGESRMAA